MIISPTYTEGNRIIGELTSYADLPAPKKGGDGGYLLQAGFRGELLENINNRSRYSSPYVVTNVSVWIIGR
jgi:hypothetical protein